jgi:hypothetical protein
VFFLCVGGDFVVNIIDTVYNSTKNVK